MAATARSRLTSKFQATIPEPIRQVLGLEAGDTVIYEVQGDKVVVRRELPSANGTPI
jgi:AbrB family looped-hinge helix DNA binding protein